MICWNPSPLLVRVAVEVIIQINRLNTGTNTDVSEKTPACSQRELGAASASFKTLSHRPHAEPGGAKANFVSPFFLSQQLYP